MPVVGPNPSPPPIAVTFNEDARASVKGLGLVEGESGNDNKDDRRKGGFVTQAMIAHSILDVPPSRIRELANIAFTMDGVLKLYFGESNLPTPQYIKDAAARAVRAGLEITKGVGQ